MASGLFHFCSRPLEYHQTAPCFYVLVSAEEFLDCPCSANWHPKPYSAGLRVFNSQAETDKLVTCLLRGTFSQICPFAESVAFQRSSFMQRCQAHCDLRCTPRLSPVPMGFKPKPQLLTLSSPHGRHISCHLRGSVPSCFWHLVSFVGTQLYI